MNEFFEVFWPVFAKTLGITLAIGAAVVLYIIAGLILWALSALVVWLVYAFLERLECRETKGMQNKDHALAIQDQEERMPE